MLARGSGILLHVTSLPSRGGIGCLDEEARQFPAFLAAAGQHYWQMLPLTPTDPESSHSPYSSSSAFAGNPLLISVDNLHEEEWITAAEARPPARLPGGRVSYRRVRQYKERALHLAFERFWVQSSGRGEFHQFCEEHAWWLDDYALYTALRERHGGKPWLRWPKPIRDRRAAALREARSELAEPLDRVRFTQWIFWRQWSRVRRACHENGVTLIGDIPIYVRLDSADVWANRSVFKLDRAGKPRGVSGVPPDYFSKTGQLWGNPVYDWKTLAKHDYLWWRQRFERNLQLYDMVRVDHFRGFVGYWEVPPRARTARNGRWMEGPGEDLFKSLARRFPQLPIIAEDLGVITADVRELIAKLELPGIRVLQFGFGDDSGESVHAPHRHERRCVVFPGTHDNNTSRGWFENEVPAATRARLERYVGHRLTPQTAADALVRLAMMSVADIALIPMQDLLRLGQSARLNRPGTTTGNWLWRMEKRALTDALAMRLRELSTTYGRN